MPIVKVVKGDLIKLYREGQFDEIVHGCNCHHTMGGGIAGQIAMEFPSSVQADMSTVYADRNKLGTSSISGTAFGLITNLYTQYYPGQEKPTDLYDNIRKGFTHLNDMIDDDTEWHCGIPLIGAGIAGGDWEIIKGIIDEVTPRMEITVVEWVK